MLRFSSRVGIPVRMLNGFNTSTESASRLFEPEICRLVHERSCENVTLLDRDTIRVRTRVDGLGFETAHELNNKCSAFVAGPMITFFRCLVCL